MHSFIGLLFLVSAFETGSVVWTISFSSLANTRVEFNSALLATGGTRKIDLPHFVCGLLIFQHIRSKQRIQRDV